MISDAAMVQFCPEGGCHIHPSKGVKVYFSTDVHFKVSKHCNEIYFLFHRKCNGIQVCNDIIIHYHRQITV